MKKEKRDRLRALVEDAETCDDRYMYDVIRHFEVPCVADNFRDESAQKSQRQKSLDYVFNERRAARSRLAEFIRDEL